MTLARRSRWATLLLWIVLAQGGASAQSSTEAPLLRPGTLAEIEERGSGSETLVLVPCMSCRWTSWEPFMARNADRWRMFAVTLPGFGGAPLPDLPLDGDEAVWQTNAVEAIGRLLVDRDLRNVTLVGHSFGASIALQAAGRYADRVTRLVNVDGPLTSPRQWFKPTGDQRVTAARQVVARNLPVLWEPDYWRSFNTPAITDPVRQRLYHGMFMATPRHVLLQYWRENHLRDLNPIVAGLRVPVLDLKMIGASTADPEAARAAHLAGLAEANAPSTLRTVFFYDTGHYVQEERPESLESAIEKFFRGGRIDDLRPGPRVTVAAPAAFGHVERAGTGPVPMILMPCLGCDWRAFDEFMARNGSRYRMFAVTWPGMGDTPLPRGAPSRDGTPLWDNLIAATARLIKEEQLEHPVLVGHSAAGPLVVRFAVEHPDLVGKVITLDATIANDATLGYSPAQRLAWADAEMATVFRNYDADAPWRELNTPPPGAPRRELYGPMWMTPPREHVLRYWAEWLRSDTGVLLPRLTVPTLALFALGSDDRDPGATRARILDQFRKNGASPAVRVDFVEDATHSIWETRPHEFDEVLVRFIFGR